ncbi:MAG: hypothetical protein KGN74_05790 [Gemmatimonadota bacterium]|nr:hypothetical protein [Gemmatimonadota bacterium]
MSQAAPGAPSPSLAALLARAVDYAGLFPPARLPMADAVRAYADYRHGPQAWMLGRFVVPAARLEEFDEAGGELLPASAAASWALSATVSADVELDTRSIHRFNDYHRDVRHGAVHVDTVELKVATPAEVVAADEFVGAFDAFLEVPIDEDPDALVAAIAGIGAKAKVRTGGLTADAIPGARQVVRFLRRCLERGVAFKATAGLHHALRGEYALTYDPGAPRGVLYGFLNVLLAAAFMRQGADDGVALALLDERDPAAIEVGDRFVRWRGQAVAADDLRAARHDAVAFGSCSFREPVDELHALSLL